MTPSIQHVRADMLILLTNDDGIYAPGLAAMRSELAKLGDVYVVAPATEQSGVGHSITYLRPLIVKEIFEGSRRRGWAVEGSPADCVKVGICEFCPSKPDLIVSGINAGLNAGINVLYSGTVAAAIEGAFFGITSFAVSLEFDEHAEFGKAAVLARQAIEQTLRQKSPRPTLYNLNIPTAALTNKTPKLHVTPMGLVQTMQQQYEKRTDPRGRSYFWATADKLPIDPDEELDIWALRQGHLTLTPLHFDMTAREELTPMRQWKFKLGEQ